MEHLWHDGATLSHIALRRLEWAMVLQNGYTPFDECCDVSQEAEDRHVVGFLGMPNLWYMGCAKLVSQ